MSATDDLAVDALPDAEKPPALEIISLRRRRWLLLIGAVVGAWAALLWMSMHLTVDESLHHLALFVHLGSLVLGLGAVLTVDFQAVMWFFGRRTRADVLGLGRGVHALIWAGLVGLLASGTLLGPDFGSTMTRLKLILVLVAALNGLNAWAIQLRFSELGGRRPSRRLMVRAAATTVLSQVAWWGAVFIGFSNNQY